MRKIILSLVVASLCVICTRSWAASTSINIAINVTGSSQPTITALTLSNTTYTSSTKGTVVGDLVLSGANNSAATFALSGPDAVRFQLSSPCSGTSCSLEASGAEPDGYHDGKFLVFITPTLAGARGSGVVYPFTVNETVACNQTVASGGTETQIADAISAASAGQNVCFADGGSFTISSTVTVSKAVRLTGVNAKTTPANTVSGQIAAFIVTASNVTIDHLNAGGTIPASPPSDVCNTSLSEFIYVGGNITGPAVRYNKTNSFMCTYQYGDSTGGPTGVVHQYNYDSGTGYVNVLFDHASGAAGANQVSNNWWQNGTPASGETNLYPFAISSDTVSAGVTFTNNIATNNPLWHCYDAHGGTDIRYISNYALACLATTTGVINMGPPPAETRPRINNNFIDLGNLTFNCCDALVDLATSGTTINCTGGDGNGCQAMNNTELFSNPGCTLNPIGAQGGTINGTYTVSGNNCSGAPATMAPPVLTTDQPSDGFVAGQSNGVIGKITVTVTPPFPSYVGGWPNYGGWPGTFSLGGPDAARFQICVDGQHLCQAAGGTGPGSYNITITGTLNGLSNSPQTSGTITLTGT